MVTGGRPRAAFEDESFDAVLCLFTSIDCKTEEGDRQAFAQFLQVLRPGAPLVIETLTATGLMVIFQQRGYEATQGRRRSARGARLRLRRGEGVTVYLSVGERRNVTFRLRCYGDRAGEAARRGRFHRHRVLRRLRGRAPLSRDAPRRQRPKAVLLGRLVRVLFTELERSPQRLVEMALLDGRRPVDHLHGAPDCAPSDSSCRGFASGRPRLPRPSS